jgi:integrase/recombinase XerC
MNISFVDLSLTPHLIDMAKEMSIVDGIPFVVGDNFSFDPTLNAALKTLAKPERRSKKTWKSYAEAIVLFMRFLNAQELHWLDVDSDVIEAYWLARRMSPSPHKKDGSAISANSWNLTVSALDVIYNWALDKGLINQLPFETKKSRENKANSKATSGMKERKEIKPKRSVNLEQYKSTFIPALENKRNSQRDISLSNFLITTGCRIEESLNITISQLPDPDSRKYAGLRVVSMNITGKGNKDRVIYIPKHILHEINIYIREDRADAHDRWKNKHPSIGSNSKEYPKSVWLSERGTNLSVNSVDKIFEVASELSGIYVHPHMLRHTFGAHTLSALIKRAIDIRIASKNQNDKHGELMFDPLRTLQRMMGHAFISTTYEYLDYIEEEEDYIYSALGLWTSEICHANLDDLGV